MKKRGRVFTISAQFSPNDGGLDFDMDFVAERSRVLKSMIEDGKSSVEIPYCTLDAVRYVFQKDISSPLPPQNYSLFYQCMTIAHTMDMIYNNKTLESVLFWSFKAIPKVLRKGNGKEIDEFWINVKTPINELTDLPPQCHLPWDGKGNCTAINVPFQAWKNIFTYFFIQSGWIIDVKFIHPRFYTFYTDFLTSTIKEFERETRGKEAPLFGENGFTDEQTKFIALRLKWNNLLSRNLSIKNTKSELFIKKGSNFDTERMSTTYDVLSYLHQVLQNKSFHEAFLKNLENRERKWKEKLVLYRRNRSLLKEWLHEKQFKNWKACASKTKTYKTRGIHVWLSSSVLGISKDDRQWKEIEEFLDDRLKWSKSMDFMKEILTKDRLEEEVKKWLC